MKENDDEGKNENHMLKSKTFEMKDYDSNTIRQNSINSVDTISESVSESLNESTTLDFLNLENQCGASPFIIYFDYFMSIFLFINSFIYYSFLNVIHIAFSFYLIYTKYSTLYSYFMKNKGRLTLTVLIIDLFYIIFKIIIDIINRTKENQILEYFFPDNWASIYEYVIVSLIMIFLLIYLIAKDFSHAFFNNFDYNRNKDFLESKIKNNNNILNSGIFLICFGCTIYPTTINLILLILGLIYFFCLLLGVKCRRFIKKHFRRFFITTVFIYILYNYIINSKAIDNDIGKIIIFNHNITNNNNNNNNTDNNTSQDTESSNKIIGDKNSKFVGILSICFFYIGFYCININIKVIQYIKYFREDIFDENTEEIRNESFDNLDNLRKPSFDDFIEMKKVSITGKIIKSKQEIKLETLFATDIDCGIIVFTKESQKYSLPKRIKLFILKFCYTPGFCLHACRLFVILWINFYMTYVSLFLILWLFFSIKYSTTKLFLYGTKYIIYPLLIILFLLSYISNIFMIGKTNGKTNNFQKYILDSNSTIFEYLGIKENFENKILNGVHLCLKIFIIILFQLFIRLETKHSRNLRDKDVQAEIKLQQKELEKSIEQDFKGRYVIKPFEIFFKLYFLGLDIAIIVFFYLSFTQTINIFNEIVLLCIISLFLMGKKFMGHLYVSLLVLNLIFFLKYILYFNNNSHKVKITSNNLKLFLSLLFNDNLNKIHYYWIAFYLLFLEYIGQTSKLFKLCKTKKFSIYQIVQYNFASHQYIKFILETIFNFIFGIYIWLLVPAFIYCLLIRDNNVFGLFQLLIVFIIYYKYIKIVGIKFNSLSNIFTYTKILIMSNVFNLTMLYAIQFLNRPPMSIWYGLNNENGNKNLELLGLFLFNENYQKHLFPYFTMFALSIALHQEINRQIKINTKNDSVKNELEKHSLRIINSDTNKNDNEEKDSKLERLLGDDNMETEHINNKNNNSNRYNVSDGKNDKEGDKEDKENKENKEERAERIEKIEQKIKENQKTKYIVKKIFIILYYILHYYWIIIFIFVAALSLHWMLSASMVIQLTIFCYYMFKSFKGYYAFLRSQENEAKLSLNQKLKKYREEKQEHFKITSQIQHSYFNLIWIFTFVFIILSYLCCIIIKYIVGSDSKTDLFYCPAESDNIKINNVKLKKFVSLMYFLGFFSAPQDKTDDKTFWSYTWGYFLIILLFSIRAYFLSKFAEIKVMYFTNEGGPTKRKLTGYSRISRQSKYLELHEIEKIQKFADQNDNVSFDLENYDSIKIDFDDFNPNESVDMDKMNNLFGHDKNNKNINADNTNINIKEEKLESKILRKQEEVEKSKNNTFKRKFFEREFNEYILEKGNFRYYSDDFNISYLKNIFNKNIEFNVSVSRKLKKLTEILILFLVFLNVLLKCNILSFMFLIIILFTYHQKNINTQLFFKISYFILLLLIIQYTIFASNLSYLTNTFIDNEMISCINNYLGIPWSNHLNYNNRWATFLSLGTNRYQIKTLWLDVSIVLLLYFYLEFFSFSLYKEGNDENELKFIYFKYNEKFKKLKTISKNEYNSLLRAMKVSYDIELKPSKKNKIYIYNENNDIEEVNLNRIKKYNKQMLKISYLFKNDKKYLFLNKTTKIKGYMKLTNLFYISFHYILLLLTLIICLINQGILAIGYICFSIFYIYKSHCFLKGRRWTLLYGINYFMKPYLFLDIVLQFVFQIPFNIYIKNNEKLKDFNNVLGLAKISDYSSNSGVMIKQAFIMVLLKILTYFLFLIQENLYLSPEFKKFILKYHYKYLQKAYIKGKLHSFLFNNYRVALMNSRLTERKNIKHSLFNIQNTVNNWNTNITNYSTNEIHDNNNIQNIYEIPIHHVSPKRKEKGITIKKIIRKHWLVSLTLKIVESARTVDDEHFNIAGEVMKILQGNTVLYSYLLNLIDDFEKKNFNKYSDIKNLKKLLEEREKLKKAKEKMKEEKKIKRVYNISNEVIDEEEEFELKKKSRKTVKLKRNNFKKYMNFKDKNNEEEKEIDLEENKIIKNNKMAKSITSSNIVVYEKSLDNDRSSSEKNLNIYKEDEFSVPIEFFLKDVGEIKKDKNLNSNKKERYIKLDQPYDDMFFANWDYKELKSIIREDFFNTCCSRKKVILMLIKAIFKFFAENFEYITYSFMLLNHLIYGSVSSIFYPIFIFLFGICQYPRPARLFWKILLVYTAFLIFLKLVIQLNIWEKIDGLKEILEDIKNDNLTFNLGFKKIDNTNFLNFFRYVFPDFLVLIVIIINQFILIRKGLWYSCETDYETIEESNDRIIKFNSVKTNNEIGINIDNKRILPQNEIISLIGKVKQPKKINIIKRISDFYKINFTRIRNEKPGKDFYMSYTIFLIIILIYIIFFYTKMEKDKMVYNLDTFKLKQFSGNTVIFAFIHVFLLVFDRFLYLKNARRLQKISFKVYDKATGEDITIRYKYYKYEEVSNRLEKDNKKEVIAYQYEDCQLGLLMKYITLILTIIFVHYFIYFYLPKTTYSNVQTLNQTVNRISENYYTLIFYIFYLFYFLFSGLQIKYGMTDIKKVSSLMKASNTFYNIIYRCYIQIPFLFELKNFIDWTFTKTSLDLWKWLKLEEIISLLFINKCLAKGEMSHRVGEKTPVYMKILMGSTTFFAVIVIIFGPLILFSYLNPLSLVNKVIGVNFQLILSIPTKFSQNLNLTLFETSNSYIDNFDSESEYDSFFKKINNSYLLNYKKSFKYSQVQNITVIYYTESNWDISTNFVNELKNSIENKNSSENKGFYLNLKYSFQREYDLSSQYYEIESKEIEASHIINIADFLDKGKPEMNISFEIDKCYSMYQRIPDGEKPISLVNDDYKSKIKIELKKDEDKNLFNWEITTEEKQGIKFITFSDLYSKVTFGYDVLTFYVTFVIVAGQVIRAIFLGTAERIMYLQMVNPNRLISLYEGIKISRIKNDLLQEEKLYYLLIDLMRSPEMIKNMTQSSLIFIQDNNTIKKNVKNKEFEVESVPIIRKKNNVSKHRYSNI